MKKSRFRLRWILLAVAVVVLYRLFAGPTGFLKLAELRRQRQTQARMMDSLATRQRELEIEKQKLLTDSAYLEKVARQELGMAKPGEKVYRFIQPDSVRRDP